MVRKMSYHKHRIDKVRMQEIAVELLKLAKTRYKYSDLRNMLDLPITVICRYTSGSVLPNFERAVKISKKLSEKISLANYINKEISAEEEANIIRILSNPVILNLIGIDATLRMAGKYVTKILSMDDVSLAPATSISLRMGKPLVIAQQYLIKCVASSNTTINAYLPKHAIHARDGILIVEAVLNDKLTLSLIKNIEKSKADLTGIYAIIAHEEAMEKLKSIMDKIEYVTMRREE
jgi:adenine/guanine phosphoribosyltransferase-like PRPP-binding protein